MEHQSIRALEKGLKRLQEYFPDAEHCFKHTPQNQLDDVILQVAERMRDNYPYPHPLYAGQMLKPPHPVAKAAYMLSLWINPNNHALDGGKASSAMEKEVVSDLAKMFGWPIHLGHLTSGGTMANLEALWVAGKLHPDKAILSSDQSHYTHQRISDVLRLRHQSVATDNSGHIDLNQLENLLKSGDVGTVVATMATTGSGAVDPLAELLTLRKKYHFRIHADAAYGGYFRLLDNLNAVNASHFDALNQVDSLSIDPHKHGLQPYGCGCILFQDPKVARFYLHDSPYTYFTSNDLHLGEISLECSRAGASAVALWATHQLLPPIAGGEFSKMLHAGREAALRWYAHVEKHAAHLLLEKPDTDIVVWYLKADRVSEMSHKAKQLYTQCGKEGLYFSLLKWPANKLTLPGIEVDEEHVIGLRACFIKPEHDNWIDGMWTIYKKFLS